MGLLDENSGLVQKAWELQRKIESKQKQFGKGKYGRVLKMARKPTSEEYAKTCKITGIGILVIGGLGFLIYLLTTIVAPWIGELIGIL